MLQDGQAIGASLIRKAISLDAVFKAVVRPLMFFDQCEYARQKPSYTVSKGLTLLSSSAEGTEDSTQRVIS